MRRPCSCPGEETLSPQALGSRLSEDPRWVTQAALPQADQGPGVVERNRPMAAKVKGHQLAATDCMHCVQVYMALTLRKESGLRCHAQPVPINSHICSPRAAAVGLFRKCTDYSAPSWVLVFHLLCLTLLGACLWGSYQLSWCEAR